MTKTIAWFFLIFRRTEHIVTEEMINEFQGRGPYAKHKVGEIAYSFGPVQMEPKKDDYELLYKRHWASYSQEFAFPTRTTFIEEEIKSTSRWLNALETRANDDYWKRHYLELCTGYKKWLEQEKSAEKKGKIQSINPSLKPIQNYSETNGVNDINNTSKPYTLKENIFCSEADYNQAMKALQVVKDPIINEKGEYCLGPRQKSAIAAWIKLLSQRGGKIRPVSNSIMAAALNAAIPGLNLYHDGSTLENTETPNAKKYFTRLSKFIL